MKPNAGRVTTWSRSSPLGRLFETGKLAVTERTGVEGRRLRLSPGGLIATRTPRPKANGPMLLKHRAIFPAIVRFAG